MKNVINAIAARRCRCSWLTALAAITLFLSTSTTVYAQTAARTAMENLQRGDQTPEVHQYLDPQFAPIGPQVNVLEVRFEGNHRTSNPAMQATIDTRAGRLYDPQKVQADVRKLIATRLFSDVRTQQQETPQGMIITFQVVERGLIEFIRFVGNEGASERSLRKEVGLTTGTALDRFSIEEGQRRLEEFYFRSGYTMAHVSVVEGLEAGDRGITYMIDEGPKQRIRWTYFVGNDFVSDGRLKTQIQSKPGYFWIFQGKVVPSEIDRDVDRLVAYYHSLGFFRVRVGREVEYTESDAWADVTFYIEEGPRYSVRNVYFTGNQRYSSDQLAKELELLPGDEFLRSDLEGDLGRINDLYGSQGFVFADIQPEVQFLEEPGQVDLVFDIQEGDQYRVGDIHIHMEGTYGGGAITSNRTVINRLSLSPGDILDMRQLRQSERRLLSSQLFQTNPAQGTPPSISVLPPDLQDVEGRMMAFAEPPVTYRAQEESFDRISPWRPMPLPPVDPPVTYHSPGMEMGVDRNSPWQLTPAVGEARPQMTHTIYHQSR